MKTAILVGLLPVLVLSRMAVRADESLDAKIRAAQEDVARAEAARDAALKRVADLKQKQQAAAGVKADPLPPFPEMADTPPADLGQSRHAADWAETFGPNSTNPAQRKKYAETIDAYNLALAKVIAQEYELLTGKKVELAIADKAKLQKQTGELRRAVAAIREQQQAEAATRALNAATAQLNRRDGIDAEIQQQAALEALSAKQHDLEERLRLFQLQQMQR